jgi:cystathionine gamma-synthase
MHSLTKYVSGHCDVLAGAFMFNDPELYDKYHYIVKTVGSSIAPFDAYLCLRGSKTLKLRAEKAAENALKIA